jgi:hypothetical protein
MQDGLRSSERSGFNRYQTATHDRFGKDGHKADVQKTRTGIPCSRSFVLKIVAGGYANARFSGPSVA